MKKICLLNFMYAIAFIGLFTACDDNEYDGPEPDEVTANYSNKLADGDRASLALTYSGSELIGKSVYFKTTDAKTAEMTLINVLPHESQTKIENISLTPDGNNGYAFSGNATATATGTAFKYDGTVTDGKLTVNLSEVKVPENEITTTGTWNLVHARDTTVDRIEPAPAPLPPTLKVKYYTQYYTLYGSVGIPGQLVSGAYSLVLKGMLQDVISASLNSITFNADGNITASYLQNEAWTDSPVNLATYYIKDSLLYVTPNVDMIIRQIRLNQAKTRAVDGTGLTEALGKIYAKINQWSTTGIPLVIRKNSEEYQKLDMLRYTRIAGNTILVLKKEEVQDFFALIDMAKIVIEIMQPGLMTKPVLQQIDEMGVQIPPEFKNLVEGMLKDKTLEMFFDQASEELENGTFEIGIYLHK